jgi:hypothetical protein
MQSNGPLPQVQCDSCPITAIIDTGSQLNIVNKSICDSKIIRLVDSKEKISIADANGGQGKLEGMVANVPLNCGEFQQQQHCMLELMYPLNYY